MKCPSETIQNLLAECNEKRKKLLRFSNSKNMANFEAFH